jgi:hypothetical protein
MGNRRFAVKEQPGNATGCRSWNCALLVALSIGGSPIVMQSAIAQTAPSQSEQFQSRIDEFARTLENSPRLKKFSKEKRAHVVEFVAGNMLFVLLHELGHAAVHELDIPVLGREEDAADAFAIQRLLGIGSQFSHNVLVEASRGWFLSDKRDRSNGDEPDYSDEHSLDRQRAYEIVCLIYGSDPTKMVDVADQAKLPADRRDSCVQKEYPRVTKAWETVLKPKIRTADQPKQKIDVVYGEGKGEFQLFADGFRSLRLLEIVAETTSNMIAWPNPFKLEMQSCGVVNAHWVESTHVLTLCYELAQDFAQLYRDYNLEEPKPAKRKRKSK